MVKKHLNVYSVLSHGEMQMKTTLRCHPPPIRMAKMKAQLTSPAGKDMVQEEHASISGQAQTCTTAWKSIWQHLRKLGIILP